MENLLTWLQEAYGITDSVILEEIMQSSYLHYIKKGERLIEFGESPMGLCFLVDGVLRGYLMDAQGKDVTDCFGYHLGAVAMPYADMMQPSPISIEAVENSVILIIPRDSMQKLLNNSIEAVRIYNQMLLAGAAEHWEIKMVMYQYNAEQKYLWFLEKYPGLINLVSHKYVASFLGMSPVTLSRIRKSLKDKILLNNN